MASHLLIPSAGSFASSTVNTNAVVDLDVRVQLAADTWDGTRPGSAAATGFLLATDALTGSAWKLAIGNNGRLQLQVSVDGTNTITVNATDVLPYVAGTLHWVRATRARATGAVTLYISDNGTTWTTVGTGTAYAGQALFATAAPVTVGDRNYNSRNQPGRYSKVEVRNGINGTLLASPDFTGLLAGQSTLVDGQGNVWSLNGSAKVWADVGATPRLGEVMQ